MNSSYSRTSFNSELQNKSQSKILLKDKDNSFLYQGDTSQDYSQFEKFKQL